MSNSYFQFKKFKVYQDKCAMKVGTDGVLLGAWCDVSQACRVLDVGTGTGLLALMIAQRAPAAIIDAVEIDAEAALQASENIGSCQWRDRITVYEVDFNEYVPDKESGYDLIVSNPPFFENSLLSPDSSRTVARHAASFGLEDFFARVSLLLADNGICSVVYPADGLQRMQEIAKINSLYLTRLTFVRGREGSEIKRVLTEWRKTPQSYIPEELIIEKARHLYTDDYIALTRDFYLKM